MLEYVLQVFYFLLPVYFSNMGAVLSAKLFKKYNTPIIAEKYAFRGKTILGKNKTWRGLIFGTLIGFLVYLLQSYFVTGLEIHTYSSLTLGFLLAFGAVFGDIVESFFKRQLNIKPGKSFIPFDQIDHVLVAMLFAMFVIYLSWSFFITGIILTFVLHVLANFIGYSLKLRDTLW